MAAIDTRFGAGGKNIQPGGSNGSPSLALALRDIADDLAGVRPAAVPALTVGAALGAFTDPPSAVEMAALRTFVNALRTDITALRTAVNTAAYTLKTTKV